MIKRREEGSWVVVVHKKGRRPRRITVRGTKKEAEAVLVEAAK